MNAVMRCGTAAIVGRPNVGKSTLLNHLVGQKISITSRKAQTTRHRIVGVSTRGEEQIVYVDTPGLHRADGRAINRYMNRAARTAMRDVDIIVMVVDRLEWLDEDAAVLAAAAASERPVILAINKTDRLGSREALLPHIAHLEQLHPFAAIVPVSALRGRNLDALQSEISRLLPQGEHLFEADQVTDRSERFLVGEIVREKLVRQLGEELPYASTVQVEEFRDEGEFTHISALVLVEKEGQKAIVIGRAGTRLKRVGTEARADIERLLGRRVMLNIWVKVRKGWADDERSLAALGYGDG